MKKTSTHLAEDMNDHIDYTQSTREPLQTPPPPMSCATESLSTGDAASDDGDEQSSEIYALASSISADCKHEGQLSDLNTIVWLLREALAQRSGSHPLRYESIIHLAAALLTRFGRTDRLEDLDEAILLLKEAPKLRPQITGRTEGQNQPHSKSDGGEVSIGDITAVPPDDDLEAESSNLTDLANTTLTQLNKSAELSSLNTAITLHHEALSLRPPPHSERWASLRGLAASLVLRFRHTNQAEDLDQGISLLKVALLMCHKPHSGRSDLLNDLSAALATRFAVTAQLVDLHDAVSSRDDALNDEPHNRAIDAAEHPNQSRSKAPVTGANHEDAQELLVAAFLMMREIHDTSSVSDIDEVIFLYRDIVPMVDSSPDLRWGAFQGLSVCYEMRFMRTQQLADIEGMIGALRELETCPIASVRLSMLLGLGSVLLKRFHLRGQLEDLNKAVTSLQEGLTMQPQFPSPSLSSSGPLLEYLHDALTTRYNLLYQTSDLDSLISVGHELLRLWPVTHPDRLDMLIDMAGHLFARFSGKSQLTDLDNAITLRQEALQLMPEHHPSRSSTLNNHAVALVMRSGKTGQSEDMNEAVTMYREVLLRLPDSHPERWMALRNLAAALSKQVDFGDQLVNPDEPIALIKEAVRIIPASHPNWLSLFEQYVTTLDQFKAADLDEAFIQLKEAHAVIPPSDARAHLLNLFATTLYKRFRSTSQLSDLDDAVAMHQEVLTLLPETHPDRARSLDNFAATLRQRAAQNAELADLDKAVTLLQEVMKVRPAPHEKRPRTLINLGAAYENRFLRTGQITDLDKSVSLLREALSLESKYHPERAESLNSLGCALDTRFRQTRQSADLMEAMALHREALKLRPYPHPQRPLSLINLAAVLHLQSIQGGGLNDLNEALSMLEEAFKLLPALHPERSMLLNNFASALDRRFMQTGHREDVDRAIELHKEVIELQPVVHPQRADLLFNLAVTLGTLYDHTHHLPDLEEAIAAYQDSLQLLPPGHPKICRYSTNLATQLVSMYLHTQQQEHLNGAMATFRTAVTTVSAPVSWRFDCAYIWATHADSKHESELEAYQAAIQLLPQLATLGLDLQSRHESLSSGSDGLARRAAACAIRSGQVSKAVELLEEGRAIFWSQALQLRAPLDELRSVSRDLAEKLESLAHALEQGSFRTVIEGVHNKQSLEQEVVHYRQLNENWLATLEEVRKLGQFKDFLIAKPLSTLQAAATKGPVVILNITRSECAALVVTLSGAKHVPLPHFNLADSHTLVNLLRHVITPSLAATEDMGSLIQQLQALPDTLSHSDRHGRQFRPITVDADAIFKIVLARLWVTIAEPIIQSLKLHKSNSPPRLWWCPTGPLAFLPIHAAGIYDNAENESVSDYVISSYTPTLTALLGPPPCTMTDKFKLMVVIQPESSSGNPPLPATRDELARIQKYVPPENLVILGIPGKPAIIDTVLSHLSTVSIAHFACHGKQDARSPLSSALLLEDGQLNLSHIMKQSIPRASLAFLSACQTAMGDSTLPDEAIHLAAALLFTGFHGTVATMWSIADFDGPKVADSFYSNLFQPSESTSTPLDISNQGPDTTQAAQALHIAVTKLRDEGCSFVRWVPFIHMGM